MKEDPAKDCLRHRFRALRQTLPLAEISAQICQILSFYPPLRRAGRILSYAALPSEVDLSDLVVAMPDKVWGIPRCLPDRQLAWHRHLPNLDLRPNRFGILEPSQSASLIEPQPGDLVLVPALACDAWGYRLGSGGGYYDRFLAHHGLTSIGIVPHACLSQEPLPRRDWDVRLTAVATERGIVGQTPLHWGG